VVVDFSAPWCGPCKKIAPEFVALAQSHENVRFGKIDVDKNTETTETYDITSMPSFLFFQDSRLIHTIQGAKMQDVVDFGAMCVLVHTCKHTYKPIQAHINTRGDVKT